MAEEMRLRLRTTMDIAELCTSKECTGVFVVDRETWDKVITLLMIGYTCTIGGMLLPDVSLEGPKGICFISIRLDSQPSFRSDKRIPLKFSGEAWFSKHIYLEEIIHVDSGI